MNGIFQRLKCLLYCWQLGNGISLVSKAIRLQYASNTARRNPELLAIRQTGNENHRDA
jgi:hypothetical protein